jgi:hypothetical protein
VARRSSVTGVAAVGAAEATRRGSTCVCDKTRGGGWRWERWRRRRARRSVHALPAYPHSHLPSVRAR